MNWSDNLTLLGPLTEPIPENSTEASAKSKALWWATINVIAEDSANSSLRWRDLFLQQNPLRDPLHPASGKNLHLPGTSVIQCKVLALTLQLRGHFIRFVPGSDVISTLLVQTLPRENKWFGNLIGGETVIDGAPPLLCSAGEIDLQTMTADHDWAAILTASLNMMTHLDELRAHSSGLAFYATVTFPWSRTSLEPSRYSLVIPRPQTAGMPALLVEPDRQWLFSDAPGAATAYASLRSSFVELNGILRGDPANLAAKPRPRWVHSAVLNPAGPPLFDWLIAGTSPAPLRLRRGEMLLTLADQSPAISGTIPRAVATVDGDVSITTAAGGFNLDFAADRGTTIRAVNPPKLEYTWDGHESFAWSDLETSYDSNALSNLLRSVHGERRPDPDEVPTFGNPARVVPAVLWGTMPLDTGWAMLPFLNTTEEHYLRVIELPKKQPGAPSEDKTTLIRGTATWGNDDPRLWPDDGTQVLASQQRWSLTLLDADRIRGLWRFRRVDTEFSLEVDLTFLQPEVTLNGFLWLATTPPTPDDSLPDSPAWPAAFQSVPLYTPQEHESYPSPVVALFPSGSLERAATRRTSDPTLDSYSELKSWQMRFVRNDKQVALPVIVPKLEISFPLSTLPSVPEQTKSLSLGRRLRWLRGATVTSTTMRIVDFYISDARHPRDFVRAAISLRQALRKVGVGNPAPDELIENFQFTDGSQPSFDPDPQIPRIESVLAWTGGVLDAANRDILHRWQTLTNSQGNPLADLNLNATQMELQLDALATVQKKPIFEALTQHPFWNHGLTNLPVPLIWRRHPRLPFIQALPLTQSRNPASAPSLSRQYAPFDLAYGSLPLEPRDWKFGGTAITDPVAGHWPDAVNVATPSKEWSQAGPGDDGRRVLPMVSLSMPGLSAHPAPQGEIAPIPDPIGHPLALQWWHGLPVLAESMALATLPRESGLTEEAAPGSVAIAPVPVPLQRETFAAAWDDLSEKALLAEADNERGLKFISPGKQHLVGLVEPLYWSVNAVVPAADYPGRLTLNALAAGTLSLDLTEPLADGFTAPTNAPSLLRGVQGSFELGSQEVVLQKFDDTNTNQVEIVAGSMTLRREADGSLRDQRGLRRKPTADTPAFLRTPLILDGTAFNLVTSLHAIALPLGDYGQWDLSIRDLPMVNDRFEWKRSALHEDVNDPAADSRAENPLQGYHWDLCGPKPQLFLGPLPFFALSLKKLVLSGDTVTEVVLTGRMQLTLPGSATLERYAEANVIQMTFNSSMGSFKLFEIKIADPETMIGRITPELKWPLQPEDGSPSLRVGTVDLDSGHIRLHNVTVDFSVLGVRWIAPVSSPLTILHTSTSQAIPITVLAPTTPVGISAAKANLDLIRGQHTLDVTLTARFGDNPKIVLSKTLFVVRKDPDGDPVSELTGSLTVPGGPTLRLSDPVKETDEQELLTPSLQLTWETLGQAAAPEFAFDLLPGFALRSEGGIAVTPGYASVQFKLNPMAGAAPTAVEIVGASELLFNCEWGTPLQEPGDWEQPQRTFASSSGSISAALKIVLDKDQQTSSLLLNGLIEVKNLISWPEAMLRDNLNNDTVQLGRIEDLSHWRHTGRILINQLTIRDDQLTAPTSMTIAGEPIVLFTLKDNVLVQFIGVVEHQLLKLGVTARDSLPPSVTPSDSEIRWVATQEVRFSVPSTAKAFFTTLNLPNEVAFDPIAQNFARLAPLRTLLSGCFRQGFLDKFLATPALPKLPDSTLVVDLSAAFLLPRTVPPSITAASNDFVAVQVLPGELDEAVLLSSQDLNPPRETDDPWALAVVPFLGRLQPASRDGLTNKDTAVNFTQKSTLCIDPVLWLTASTIPDIATDLTSRSRVAQTITLRPFDSVKTQSVPWLDQVSLETALHRLLTPPAESFAAASEDGLAFESILAATPQSGAGRLSRKAALDQAFAAELVAYPPGDADSAGGPDPDAWTWRAGALLVNHSQAIGAAADFGFYSIGKRFGQIAFGLRPSAHFQRLTCVTLLPLPMIASHPSHPLAQSVSLAVSPYLALRRIRFSTAEPQGEPAAIFADIVVAGLANVPVVLASRLWQRTINVTNGTRTPDQMPDDSGIIEWAKGAREGLAADSHLAVVRVRKIYGAPGSDQTRFVISFLPLPSRALPIPLVFHAPRPLRAELGCLFFREGQFGGTTLATGTSATLLAPPLVARVEPLHFEKAPAIIASSTAKEALNWDWGWSGLDLTLDFTGNATGTTNQPNALTWMAVPHPLQFASQMPRRTRLLPKYFRSPAIRSLLTAPPGVPVPGSEDVAEVLPANLNGSDEPWIGTRPGMQQLGLVGGRPGTFLSLRSHLQTRQRVRVCHVQLGTDWPKSARLTLNYNGVPLTVITGSDPALIADLLKRATAGRPEFQDLTLTSSPGILEISWSWIDRDCTLTSDPEGLIRVNQMLRDSSFTSGSVPVQHRWPRPVHLPANRPDTDASGTMQRAALVPWGNWFDLAIPKQITLTASAGDSIRISFTSRLGVHVQTATATASGQFAADIEWPHLPAGRVTVTATANGASVNPQPAALANFVKRSVDARPTPHDSLFALDVEDGKTKVYSLDVELVPLVPGEPAALSDRWPDPFEVVLRITRLDREGKDFFQLSDVSKLNFWKLTLAGPDQSVTYKCKVPTAPPPDGLYRFEPVDLIAVRRLLSVTPHGTSMVFQLAVPVVVSTGGIQGPPLLATLPLCRVRINELPMPIAPMYCNFEDPEYNRRLTSPTSQITKPVGRVGSGQTVPVLLALDRREYNPSSPFFMALKVANVWASDTDTAFILTIARIDTAGLRAKIAEIPVKRANLNRVISLRFGTTESANMPDIGISAVLAAGERVEFEIHTTVTGPGSGVLVFETLALAVPIVADAVAPPPEAAYALLRSLIPEAARAIATIANGKVKSIDVIVAGAKYNPGDPPAVIIAPPNDLGAGTLTAARAHVDPAKIDTGTGKLLPDAIVIDNHGLGYTGTVEVQISFPAVSQAVECIRFAWSPAANRMEFVDPNDLTRDAVRRRAVFAWQDTVRIGHPARYGVQKIHPTGSTLLPALE